MVQVQKCLHTAILVSDLEKAEHFYGEILQLSKIERTLKYPGAWYQVGDYQIHLMADPAAKTKLTNAAKWGRNPHFALSVTDLNQAIARLTQHNCPLQMSASGRAALFVRDPDGNIIELSQI